MNGPKFEQLSLRLTKAIPASFGQLDVIAEAFNLTNHDNRDVQSVVGGQYLAGPTIANPKAAYVPNKDFGKYNAHLPSREVQLGLRWIY